MRNFLYSVKLSDLIQGVDTGGETTVKAENLAFNDCSEGQVIEKLSEMLPYIGVSVFPQAFIVEAIPSQDKMNRKSTLE